MVEHSTSWHSMAQHSTPNHGIARCSTSCHSTAQRSTSQHSMAQRIISWHSMAQHSKLSPSATIQPILTFPEGEAALYPRAHTAHQGHLVTRLQPHAVPLLHSLIVHIGAIAAVVLQHSLPCCTCFCAGPQMNAAVEARHPCVCHFYKAHFWQMLAAPAIQKQLVDTAIANLPGYSSSSSLCRWLPGICQSHQLRDRRLLSLQYTLRTAKVMQKCQSCGCLFAMDHLLQMPVALSAVTQQTGTVPSRGCHADNSLSCGCAFTAHVW